MVSNLHLEVGGLYFFGPVFALDGNLGASWEFLPTGRWRVYLGTGVDSATAGGGDPPAEPSEMSPSRAVFAYGLAGAGVRWGRRGQFSIAVEAGVRVGHRVLYMAFPGETDRFIAPIYGVSFSTAVL